ncbi:hypothetical protein B4589_002735 [Halolamina sp. CBA1230]|uniref:hypothetical protein n=1 Tax=Halolamina sp. CBA1230 TaxID=1853690 RepID=UPI0009A22061|nr:hypothetical protein [Halolamina sp. CBA1230]QKY19343.1 hypothetical protein B4589_002735 [Halolamina sp. CBA1230]
MERKNRFVQDTEVLIYRLSHGNVDEAKRLVEQLCLVAESLAQDLEDGDRKQFLRGTSELMARFRKQIVELEEEGKPDEEITGTVLDAMNDHFTHDVTEFALDLRAEESVDAENTIDRLVEENEWLRRELQSAEADYMELYEEMQRADRAVDP